jgi:hypothetical protein
MHERQDRGSNGNLSLAGHILPVSATMLALLLMVFAGFMVAFNLFIE